MRSRRYIGAFDNTDAIPDVEEDAPTVAETIAVETIVSSVAVFEEPLSIPLSTVLSAPTVLSTVLSAPTMLSTTISGTYDG